MPVLSLLGVGLVGVGMVVKWCLRHQPDEWRPGPVAADADKLALTSCITEQHQVEALLSEVRIVLARFGVSLGKVPLRVRLLSEAHALEGMTTKVLRPPPLLRGIDAVSLRRNLNAVTAVQVLAHEYTHAWLWLSGFPHLEPRLEEGLCELLSYLTLLSYLREPPTGGVLLPDPDLLRRQIISIEANSHPDYGGGFRECVEALHGRTLHELLHHVREHARLPPPLLSRRDSADEDVQSSAAGPARGDSPADGSSAGVQVDAPGDDRVGPLALRPSSSRAERGPPVSSRGAVPGA